jgi:hypothetical protein
VDLLKILEKTGPVAYMAALLASMRVHNVFHVSLLKKYVPESNHIIDWNVIQVEHEGDFRVEPVRILDNKVKVFKKKAMGVVRFNGPTMVLNMNMGELTSPL